MALARHVSWLQVTWFNNLTVWDVKTKQKLRIFPGGPTPDHGWPVFKWSHDEAYLAKITEDNIHIFDSSTMKLVQPDPKKATTLFIPRVRAFDWSPTEVHFPNPFHLQREGHVNGHDLVGVDEDTR